MDVSFTNVLEGARQYFQGLPATSGSTEGPSYSSANQQQPQHNSTNQNHDRTQPSSVPYWPPQQEPLSRPPTRERTPAEAQRPPSQHSDQQRPSSHNQSAGHGQQEASRTPSGYHQGYSDLPSTQSFQFQRPHSREVPTSAAQHQQYSTHMLPNPSYHQPPSPQQPRTPSRTDHQSPSPSYHQLQPPQSLTQQYPPHSYANYQQRQQYYNPPTINKSPVPVVNSYNKIPQSQPHGQPHENSYIKSYPSYSQNSMQTTNHYSMDKPSASYSQDTKTHISTSQSMTQVQPTSQSHRTTHNLPPIAALSSVNYHSSRNNRDTLRLNNQRPRNIISTVTNTQSVQHRTVVTTTISSQAPSRISEHYSAASSHDYRNGPQSSDNRHHQSKVTISTPYASATTITTSYTYPIAAPTSNSYPSHPHQSSSQHPGYKVATKPFNSDPNRSQPPASVSLTNHTVPTMSHPVSANSSVNIPTINQSSMKQQKRESPLDLSVKTVRTPADSTLDDVDDSQRNNKYYSNNRSISQTSSQAPSHGYPTYEVYTNQIQRNFAPRSNQQLPSVGAPKVDFLPNFNVPAMNHQPASSFKDVRKVAQTPYDKTHHAKVTYDNKTNMHQQMYHVNNTQRFQHTPASVSTNVHSYNVAKNTSVKKPMEGLPRMEFPPPGHGHKTSAMYSMNNPHDNRKRPADIAPSLIPNKVSKVENWKHLDTIDQQIEQKLNSYVKSRMQQDQKQSSSMKQMVNGSYVSPNQERPKENYSNQQAHRPQYSASAQQQNFTSTTQYQQPPGTHAQTYVPSAVAHQYPGYSSYGGSQQQTLPSGQQPSLIRTNSNSSLAGATPNRTNIGGAADKRVLSLLRNSLEIKGAKEAQRKLEQDQNKFHEVISQPSRPIVQQPTTDVTAPLQPKTGIVGRHNVSPFTASSLLERASNTPPAYKFHIPKAIDSVRIEEDVKASFTQNEKQDASVTLTNPSSTDLDGLAAFLAARIRTKAELKQVGSAQSVCNNNTANVPQVTNVTDIERSQTPTKQIMDISSTSQTSSNASTVSPPKPAKERTVAYSPRRKLFSRAEEDNHNNENSQIKTSNVPPRDKSGLRSSSETSIFDFPDSDSDTEMTGFQKQSLEDMRRDRKSIPKPATVEVKIEIKQEVVKSRTPSPSDNMFDLACDSFLEQLKKGIGKKKCRRKRMESDVLASLEETLTKEKPDDDIKIKIENDDSIKMEADVDSVTNEEDNNEVTKSLLKVEKEEIEENLMSTNETSTKMEEKKELNNIEPMQEDSDSDAPLIKVKKKSPTKTALTDGEEEIISKDKSGARIKIESSSENSSDSESESVQAISDKMKVKKIKIETTNQTMEMPKLPINIYAKPSKKPSFGDGTDFHPGWEEELYRYKKALRMPPSLIHVTRPPNCQRLSTSLPDLDPCPMSPATSSVADNSEYSRRRPKARNEVLDSDVDSNCSFNFSFNRSNYDSEEGGSVKSLNMSDSTKRDDIKRKEGGILDKLLERYGRKKRKKTKKKDEPTCPKIIPKAENPIELLPTPSLEVSDSQKSEPIVKGDSVLLGFRKKTLDNFKDAFINTPNSIVGVNAPFATVVLKSRTRTETRVLKQKATIREVFGEDRPASAPPVTCVDDLKLKDCEPEDVKSSIEALIKDLNEKENGNSNQESKDIMMKPLGKTRKSENLLKTLATKVMKGEYTEEMEHKDIDTKSEIDAKSETPSLDGDETILPGKKKNKLRNMRRKFSSGFDYIRKKKKQSKKEGVENSDSNTSKPRGRGRGVMAKANIESVQDIQKEIKTWVLNKGIGETHLHRAARLGYTDITAYCLEKMDCIPSPKDNAGYTPLHEACSRGHLDIARLLLMYGANVSESAQGGIRPLHEAVENGFVEIVRLLLSYGADPLLATYTGLTPLSLAVDDITASLLQQHIDDVQGKSTVPWNFLGPASCFDIEDTGYDPLQDVPEADPPEEISDDEFMEFEVSETPLPNLYSFKDEGPTDRWILLQDLSTFLKIKSRDALLKQINPPSTSSSVNNKQAIREMKMAEFLEQAHCCQFLNANEKINTRASKIALVKYTDRVKQLLNVEKFVISER